MAKKNKVIVMGNSEIIIKQVEDEMRNKVFEQPFENPKFSIIVPAYNIQDYISPCLFSLVNQTFKEIEIIVVNDGSKDDTLSILSAFEKFDKRVKIIDRENKGLGATRNEAVKFAKSDYVLFVDGDDKLDEKTLELLYDAVQKSSADIIVYGAKNLYEDKLSYCGYDIKKLPKKYREKVLDSEIIKKIIFKLPPVAWTKLCKKSFLEENDLKFQEDSVGEDQIFHVSAFLLANSCYVTSENLYHYRRNRVGSIMYGKKRTNSSPIFNFYAIEKFVLSKDFSGELRFKILDRYFKRCVSWLSKCDEKYKDTYYPELMELCNHLNERYKNVYWKNVKFSKNISYLTVKFELATKKLFYRGKNCVE